MQAQAPRRDWQCVTVRARTRSHSLAGVLRRSAGAQERRRAGQISSQHSRKQFQAYCVPDGDAMYM